MTFPVSVALCMGAWVGGVCVVGVGGVGVGVGVCSVCVGVVWCGCSVV